MTLISDTAALITPWHSCKSFSRALFGPYELLAGYSGLVSIWVIQPSGKRILIRRVHVEGGASETRSWAEFYLRTIIKDQLRLLREGALSRGV